VHGVAVNV